MNRSVYTATARAMFDGLDAHKQQLMIRMAFGIMLPRQKAESPGRSFFTAQQWAAKVACERQSKAEARRIERQSHRDIWFSLEQNSSKRLTAPKDWKPKAETRRIMAHDRKLALAQQRKAKQKPA